MPGKAVLTTKKRGQQSQKGSAERHSKRPKASEGFLALREGSLVLPIVAANEKPDYPCGIVLTLKRWKEPSQNGSANMHSEQSRRTPRAGDGISTGPGFVVPPELARLRRKSLYKDLAMFVNLEELDRSIEEQIIAEGEENDDLVETWTNYYEEFLEQQACGYHDEGFGADDV